MIEATEVLDVSHDSLFEILNLQQPMLLRVAERICPESAADRASDALRLAWERFSQFRGKSDGELHAWLRAIVRNECFAYFKSKSRTRPLPGGLMVGGKSPSRAARIEEERRTLIELLASLTDEQREAIFYRYFEGWTVAQIALQMDKSITAVAGLLRHGLEKLRTRTSPSEWSQLLS